ncbi:MAG: thioredoxin family protein [Candidatus Gastranaerophilales bacterium]|nr:thioredoxin family protein [Candidatus Gastranaerophilales bacterium]
MKQKLSIVAILLIMALPITFYSIFKAPDNYNTAVQAAVDKPMVIEFSAPLCSECVKLKKVLEVVEPQYTNKITFQKISTQMQDKSVMDKIEKYSVKVVPTTILIDKNGNVVKKFEGSMSAESLKNLLDQLVVNE